MKRQIYILILSLVALTSVAQTPQERQAIQQVSRAAATIKTMQADFVQTKHLRMLGDKMVSRGRMCYQQSDRLRWEYTKPYAYTFILNGNSVMMSKGGHRDVVDVNRNKVFREIAQMMMSSVVGTCLTDSKRFKVSMTVDKQTCTATLLPQKKDVKAMFTRIVLVFTRKTSVVSKVIMYEKNGDRTEITLDNVRIGAAVSPTEFTIK